ncbi:MAG TPA: BadF/BadG/BcrA/BcrD ATPase family protein [Thermomicrobiales bacterium]|nr:BadF/BadG/BcrA/BcrD ATPase family protein [Thermomicrobiales bacterium]
MTAPLVLGVDAGNSKTVALVAGPDGVVLGAGRGGPGDIYGAHGEKAALAEIGRAVDEALRTAGVAAARIDTAGFSMAGADWPEDFALLQAAMAERGYGRRRTIVNDAIGALWAGIPDGVGIVITCGTGAAIGARSAAGRIWHSSFWPDAAGGYRLGERAIRAAIAADLGLAPATRMTAPLLAAFGVDSVEAMLHRRTRRRPPWTMADAARLAPIVLDAARDGDPAAVAIVAEQGRALGDMGVVAARQTGQTGRVPTALAGGIFRHPCNRLREAVIARLRRDLPDIEPISSDLEPVGGAVVLALAAMESPADAAFRRRLRETMPGLAFFAT